MAKVGEIKETSAGISVDIINKGDNPADKLYFYVRVSRLDNGANQFYLSENFGIKIGDTVTVPTEKGSADGIVIATTWHTAADAPQVPKDTMWIL